MMNDYVAQKLRQIDEELLNDRLLAARMQEESRSQHFNTKPVVGPVLRFAGRTLRRVGSGLEDWAEPPKTTEQLELRRRVS